MEKKKRIHIELSPDTFQVLKSIKLKVGDPSWDKLVTRAILEYGEIGASMMYCTGNISFSSEGKMIVDIAPCLAKLLDARNYWLGEKNPPRWKVLRVQAVFQAFAWYLAHVDELRHFWDHTGEYFAEYLINAFRDIGLEWEQLKSHVKLILTTLYSMYPWLWNNEYASEIGRHVLEKLEEKYPEVQARWAAPDEDTRSAREIYTRMEILHYAQTGRAVSIAPPLCIEGVSVITAWRDETGEHVECYTFVD